MSSIKPAFKMFLWMTLLTGVLYPALVTVVAQSVMPAKANGSLITVDGNVVGSDLIGQNFIDQKYFWSRPSATGYNPLPSGGSNLGLISKALQERVLTESNDKTPTDLLFTSASGLDPHITLHAALFQIKRIASARNLNSEQINRLEKLVYATINENRGNIFGEKIVNVLKLNLSLKNDFK